eukprot:TRINITY_DN27933_c0_g1_i1.p1 TRINITY_DN27933_c0_g1~~TRINITY_DN27933_c0_g1_i1.p1  ORF type:complete len:2207 (-),score=147.99 TRINITY_DN27933_c0_g1_i1:320-6940(-)
MQMQRGDRSAACTDLRGCLLRPHRRRHCVLQYRFIAQFLYVLYSFAVAQDKDNFQVHPQTFSVFGRHRAFDTSVLTLRNSWQQNISARVSVHYTRGGRRLSYGTTGVQMPKRSHAEVEGMVSSRRLVPDDVELPAGCSHNHRILFRLRDDENYDVPSSAALKGRGAVRRRLLEDAELGVLAWQHLPHVHVDILELGCENFSSRAADVVQRLRSDFGGQLVFAEIDQRVYPFTVPNDPAWSQLWGMTRMKVERAWAKLASLKMSRTRPIVVAVIDTGVNVFHEDLETVLWTNAGEIPGNGVDDDNNGYIDDIHGYDFYSDDGDPQDSDGHGTHCAGVIAALANNGRGVAGVASQYANVKVMALRFLDGNGGSISNAVRAIDYAVSMGAHISSNSWGGTYSSTALNAALRAAEDAGQMFFAAAGNAAADNDRYPHYPCNIQVENMICVASSTSSDSLASYSNYGATSVHLAAAGSSIYSTYSGAVSAYKSLSGTSMATPHVAGAAALLLSAFGFLDAHQVKTLLLENVEQVSWLHDKVISGGLLDVYAAVRHASSMTWLNLFLDFDGDTANNSFDVVIGAGLSTAVYLRVGGDSVDIGHYHAIVEVSWYSGQEVVDTVSIPVSYTLEGWSNISAEWNNSVVDFEVVIVNSTVTQELNIRNTGNGTAWFALADVPPEPFLLNTDKNLSVQVNPFESFTLKVGCKPTRNGSFESMLTLRSTCPQSDSPLCPDAVSTPLVLTLQCQGSAPPKLGLEYFSGAALMSDDGSDELFPFEPSVPAEWETSLDATVGAVNATLMIASNLEACSSLPPESMRGFVALVARGTCYFEEKARNAQLAGAVGVLIYDNRDVTTIQQMSMPVGARAPLIPAFLITKASGLALRSRLQSGGRVPAVALRWKPLVVQDGPLDAPTPRRSLGSLLAWNAGTLGYVCTVSAVEGFGLDENDFYRVSYGDSKSGSSFSSFAWSILGSNAVLDVFHGAHNVFAKLELPFAVPFYGRSFSRVFLWRDGVLVFRENEDSVSSSDGIVAPFWDDLTCGQRCSIRFGIIDESGRSTSVNLSDSIGKSFIGYQLVFQFANMHFADDFAADSAQLSFEVRMSQDGLIQMMFRDFPSSVVDRSSLAIGVYSLDGRQRLSIHRFLPFQTQSPFGVNIVPRFSTLHAAAAVAPGEVSQFRFLLHAANGQEARDRHGRFLVSAHGASGSWTAQLQVRVVQKPYRFSFSIGEWGPCLSAACHNESENVSLRFRDVACLGSDGSSYSVETCSRGMSACEDVPLGWRDTRGYSCEKYVSSAWCTAAGGYGPQWISGFYGSFERYSTGGYSARIACCGCGGGLRLSTPLVQEVCADPSENSSDCDEDSRTNTTAEMNRSPTDTPRGKHPTSTPTMEPTSAPTTLAPTRSLTFDPTRAPTTTQPTVLPSFQPTRFVSNAPSFVPTTSIAWPTMLPSIRPTSVPTISPTNQATLFPTHWPTSLAPTLQLTSVPTFVPSLNPTHFPPIRPSTSWPTRLPSASPTGAPTLLPTQLATLIPTSWPTSLAPTLQLTSVPTFVPSLNPTHFPPIRPSTSWPTRLPSASPTGAPTLLPTKLATLIPTSWPTSLAPTLQLTSVPTFVPSLSPTYFPTIRPLTSRPTRLPSASPTGAPTLLPTKMATLIPTSWPTSFTPTLQPTLVPTFGPTALHTYYPTVLPSTVWPTKLPSFVSTLAPSISPTHHAIVFPTLLPTTLAPTVMLTAEGTSRPSIAATAAPSVQPTPLPTVLPSSTFDPSNAPTSHPTPFPSLPPPSAATPRVPTVIITQVPSSLPSSTPVAQSASLIEAPTLSPLYVPPPSTSPSSAAIYDSSPSAEPTALPVSESKTLKSALTVRIGNGTSRMAISAAVRASIAGVLEVNESLVAVMEISGKSRRRARRLSNRSVALSAPLAAVNSNPAIEVTRRLTDANSDLLIQFAFEVRFVASSVFNAEDTERDDAGLGSATPTEKLAASVGQAVEKLDMLRSNASSLRDVLVTALKQQPGVTSPIVQVEVDEAPAVVLSERAFWAVDAWSPCAFSDNLDDGEQCMGSRWRTVQCQIVDASSDLFSNAAEDIRYASADACEQLPLPLGIDKCEVVDCVDEPAGTRSSRTAETGCDGEACNQRAMDGNSQSVSGGSNDGNVAVMFGVGFVGCIAVGSIMCCVVCALRCKKRGVVESNASEVHGYLDAVVVTEVENASVDEEEPSALL